MPPVTLEHLEKKSERKTTKPNPVDSTSKDPIVEALPSRAQLLLGLIFGIAFGFLLQKGGVAKYEILIGQLLLKDFTVAKVILSAVVVGMIGIGLMRQAGWVQSHVKPTKVWANVIGGLIFGAGFGLAAYCPGTGAAALGQGNLDALAVVAGLMAGSYVYALFSKRLDASIGSWNDLGEKTLDGALGVSHWVFMLGFALFLTVVLLILQIV